MIAIIFALHIVGIDMSNQVAAGTTLNNSGHHVFELMGHDVAADIDLAGLPLGRGDKPAITIRNSGLWFTESWRPHRYSWSEDEDGIHYVARDIGEFHVRLNGQRIDYSLAPNAHLDDIRYMLTGPIASLAFQLQGEILLHCVGLVVGETAVALAGDHGTGKSTLAASFQHHGTRLLTDDVLPLQEVDDHFRASESVPWIKLGLDSLQAIGACHSDYPLVHTTAEKWKFPRYGALPGSPAIPLGAIYILRPHNDSNSRPQATCLVGSNAAMAVLANMYSAATLKGKRGRAAFEAATRIAERVPVRKLEYYRSYGNLPAIRAAILSDAAEVTSGIA